MNPFHLSLAVPPMWSPSFYVAYDESFTNKDNRTYTFNGQFFYDAVNNRQRADKVSGRYDNTCNSVLPNVTTKCQHLVVNDKRWIVYPEKSQCCYCCDTAHGCGIVKRDWFKDGKYLGKEKIVDTMYDKYVKPGIFYYYLDIADAFYWVTADENEIPRRFAEDNNTHVIDYLTHTYVNKTIDSSIFALPSYCNATCPEASVCTKFRS